MIVYNKRLIVPLHEQLAECYSGTTKGTHDQDNNDKGRNTVPVNVPLASKLYGDLWAESLSEILPSIERRLFDEHVPWTEGPSDTFDLSTVPSREHNAPWDLGRWKKSNDETGLIDLAHLGVSA